MKIARRYTLLVLLMAVGLFFKFYILNVDYSQIDVFRGGSLVAEEWNPLVAKDVNESLLKVTIDNHEYTNKQTSIYMNDNRNIMIPVSMLRDAFNCSAKVYDDTEVLLEKHDFSLLFQLDSDVIQVGEEEYKLSSPLCEKNDELYISLDDVSQLLSYNSTFDINEKLYLTTDTSESASIVPTRYDLREKERVASIRNQGSYGTCWAFSALSAMESTLLPETKETFAVDHMALANSFDVDLFDGGDYTMGMAYLAAWQGPVRESDDPYGDSVTDESLTAAYHVQEMQVIDGKDYEDIKNAVFKYGGVETSLYISLTAGMENAYYNKEKASYCYIGTEKPNHGVVIIGWDDNYSKENFSSEPEGDGAFICQNSWGTNFGENGVFYVSYYDTNIGTHNVVYTKIEDVDNYDHIYQSDLCGWRGKLGNNNDSLYGANVFTATGDQKVAAASFYATGANSKYRLYVVKNFENEDSFTDRQLVAEGSLDQGGYYTIDFDTPINVDKGERYAIVLYIETPESTHPLAMEYDSGDDSLASVDLTDGESYFSYTGNRFFNVKEQKDCEDCNICIKAFTFDR